MGKNNVIFYAVFFMAGVPTLLYQTVWQRVLTLYFGVDIYSTTVTVASVMLGLGLGSLLGGRLADRVRSPLFFYVLVEVLIGVCGLVSLPVFSYVGAVLGGSSLWIVIPTDFLLLLLPTFLMGMTLPLMCRVVTRNRANIGSDLAHLYGWNTLGAAAGALLSSYYLCGMFGLDGTTRIAAGMNFALAATIAILGRRESTVPLDEAVLAHDTTPTTSQSDGSSDDRLLLGLSFLSGFVGLGYEIVWYRILTLLLHGTVYVFGTILCCYLLGVAAGALLAGRRTAMSAPLARFGASQLGISVYTFLLFALLEHGSWLPGVRHLIGASSFTTFHPSPELISGTVSLVTLYSALDIPFWTLLILGVPTVLMGYGFPLLLRAGSQTVEGLGRSVGRLYFVNILGATLGTLIVGFVLLEWLGMEATLAILVVLGCLPALVIFTSAPGLSRMANYGPRRNWWRLCAALVMIGAAIVLPWRTALVTALHYGDSPAVAIITAEDKSGVVALRRQDERIVFSEEDAVLGQYRLYIDGAAHGGYENLVDIATEPAADWAFAGHESPRRVLCIGFGDGKMCASALQIPTVTELIIVELNSALATLLAQTPQGDHVLSSPKVRLVIDDGRRWLRGHPDDKFDVVMTWPLHAAHSHSGNLYSVEFFTLIAEHLSPGGILFTRSADIYSTPKTLASVFPYVVRADRGSYAASFQPLSFDLEQLGLDKQDFHQLVEADRELILANTQDAPLNRDLRPNTEFYLTYPYVWTLQTWGRPPDDHGYRLADPARVEALIRVGGTTGLDSSPAAAID